MTKEVCLRPISLSFTLARMSSTTLRVSAVNQWHLSEVCSLVWFSALMQISSQLKTLNGKAWPSRQPYYGVSHVGGRKNQVKCYELPFSPY